jgi:cytochrome c oxidase assembly protein subunit 15
MDVGAQPVSRLRGFSLSDAAIRRLLLVNAAALVLIVATGATVRLTGSGLGCEHWPGCTPHHFEPKSGHSYVEFGNRVIAFLTILTTLATWIFARGHRRLAALIFFGTLAQAPLGLLTIRLGLHPLAVATHFLLALAVLAAAMVIAVEARGNAHGRAEPAPRWLRLVGLVLALACGVLVVTGTLSTAAGPHPGDKAEVDRFWNLLDAVYLHVRATAVFGTCFLLLLAWLVRHRDRAGVLGPAAVGLLVLLLVQMSVGELQWRNQLPWWLVLIHVGLAAAVWAWTVGLVTALWRTPRKLTT